MLYIANGNVKPESLAEYQSWLDQHAKELQRLAPPGWTFQGIYTYELGLSRFNAMEMWEFDNWSDIDVWMAYENDAFDLLREEKHAFYDKGEEAFVLNALARLDGV
ncbi:MAG: hypothetical protein ACE5MG_10220 [Candidatus Methylomirabilales bacterium]